MTTAETEWALALFRKSVLKQAKLRRILDLLDDPSGKANLDIGADNGVISFLLRQRGGRWASADLDERAVASIRQLVGTEVYQLDGARTPFPDRSFDQIVIVDYLEHIPDDRAFSLELERILRPGGTLIVNVPHLQPGSPLNRFRHRIGLTDEWHGHLRPGYTLTSLRETLGPRFRIDRAVTYSTVRLRARRHGAQRGVRGDAKAESRKRLEQGHCGHAERPRPVPQAVPHAVRALPGAPRCRGGRRAPPVAAGSQAHRSGHPDVSAGPTEPRVTSVTTPYTGPLHCSTMVSTVSQYVPRRVRHGHDD